MRQSNTIEIKGTVMTRGANGIFSVVLDNDFEVQAHLSGKLKRKYIKIMPGDRVLVELSPYDISYGRITERCEKLNNPYQMSIKTKQKKRIY